MGHGNYRENPAQKLQEGAEPRSEASLHVPMEQQKYLHSCNLVKNSEYLCARSVCVL